MHLLVCQLFWLQVEADFTLKPLNFVGFHRRTTSSQTLLPVRKFPNTFGSDRKYLIDFGKNGGALTWMSRPRPRPHSGPLISGRGEESPYHSIQDTTPPAAPASIDVLAQDVGRMLSYTDPCFGHCFPPTQRVGVVTAHLRECRARSVIVIPAVRLSCFPLVASASVRSLQIASPQESNVFFRVHHLKGETPVIFSRWGMRAVEVDFRLK